MQGKKKRMVPSPSETQVKGFQSLVTSAAVTAGGSQCSPDDSENFYTKLTELLESSGLSLIFNVRETMLDLYLFYLEVTRKGGYYQVGRENKWGEVASALKLEGNNAKLSAQVEKLYAHLLYKFEQLYFYRDPAKQAAASSTRGTQRGKRNSTTSLSQLQLMDNEDGQKVTKICEDCACPMTEVLMQYFAFKLKVGAGYVEQPVLLPAPSNDKQMKKRRGAPQGQRNAYQIFLKQECARLKTCSQVPDGPRILRMAVDAWKKMSVIEKQPYVEESKKSKEKFKEAMITYNKQQKMQDIKEGKRPSPCGGDYYVNSQPEADDTLVNEAAERLALEMTQKTPKDSLFLIDLDAYCSLDLPTGESK